MFQFFRFVVILPVLVVDFELRTFLFQQLSLGFIELGNRLDTVRTVIIWALVNGHFLLQFPSKESQTTMGTEELRLSVGSEALLELEELRANLAENLRALLSVIEVEISIWCSAAGTDDMHWNR